MKILMMNRKDCFTKPGGDTVQMVKTKEYLEKLYNLSINFGFSEEDIVRNGPDIVHIFNIQTYNESEYYVRIAKKYRKKIVLSPIYWDLYDAIYVTAMFYRLKITSSFTLLIFRNVGKNFIKFYNDIFKKIRRIKIKYILNNSDIILPNSEEEYQIISDEFGFKGPYKVVYNGVDNFFCKKQRRRELNKKVINILTVGRIEPSKNQLNVLKAITGIKNNYNDKIINYTMIGRGVPEYISKIYSYYYNKKLKEKGINIIIKEEVEHSKIIEEYLKADMHILASFRESPGLASLEALATGCKIIVSDSQFCPVHTYFEHYPNSVFTCNPYKISNIQNAILKALETLKKNNNMEIHSFPFTWDVVAKQTYEAYNTIYNG